MKDIRFVVLHAPGPTWRPGAPIFEQEGIHAHIGHYRQWLEEGKLELGGPFLDEHAGGMMIPVAGLSEAEITAFATADPAVASGLLQVAVRQWLVGMKR
ncbi:MAG: hypothetical protein QM722_22715 [Piscinibacter sp.]